MSSKTNSDMVWFLEFFQWRLIFSFSHMLTIAEEYVIAQICFQRIIIIIWFVELSPCHMTLIFKNVMQTRKCEPCQLNNLQTLSCTWLFHLIQMPKDMNMTSDYLQFNRHTLDNNR